MVLPVPLPSDYFTCPPLSKRDIDYFIEIGRQSMEALVQKADLFGGTYDWKLLKDESELKIYKGHSATEDSMLHCGVMQVVGDLDENMALHRDDTTEQAREYIRRFGRIYADVINLYTVVPRRPDRPNDAVQIKWILAKNPLNGVVARRDFVMLESEMEFQVGGKRAWVRSYRSIELAAVPDMRKELNCIRASMHDTGFIVVESDRPGYLDVTYLADLDIKGHAPAWIVDQTLKFWLRSMHDIDRFMRENRLSRSHFLAKDQLCPLYACRSCALCRRKFGPLRKKTHCQKCGEVLCTSCNRLWNVNINGMEAQVRACVTCSLRTSTVGARKASYASRINLSPTRWALLVSTGPRSELQASTVDDDAVSVDLSAFV
ncbi:unnamed protein product [Aphanomyces euteiches]|uniref:FYVE-type domain-containing protein n=1 Tax=Aphanomyces euteiches TaxID=100861 RepID=A0A6G0WNX3_9STRA|nr:hypothetical protein Ae201684_013199 [Aphanomyces euteiches]KAH9143447.1 hypothetical protein AeRB84_012552 [Aphanomyces euteiches]